MRPRARKRKRDARRRDTERRGGVPDHERRNRAFWDADADDYQAAHAPDLTHAPEAWGAWRIPEADVGALGDVAGRDVLDYGCGAAHWSIALAARGARPVALDQSRAQLRHARPLQPERGVSFPLVCASGEAIPLRSASFDVVMSDHGAVSFCDPDRSIPEVARVLRPGGRLVFCAPTWLLYVTWDPTRRRQTRRLVRPYFDVDVFATSEGTVDFVVRTGEWIRRMRTHGLVLDDLVDLRPPEGATTTYTDFVPYRWARRWPAEQLWIAHRQA